MSYDLEKAYKRFQWRFQKDKDGKFKQFKPTDLDVEAINIIFGWISREKEKSVSNNVLFAKLYIYDLTMRIRRYGTTVFDDYPQKELSRLLERPLHVFYEAFYNDLHNNQLNKYTDDMSEQQRDEILLQAKRNRETFTLKMVSDKLAHMITESLNRFK